MNTTKPYIKLDEHGPRGGAVYAYCETSDGYLCIGNFKDYGIKPRDTYERRVLKVKEGLVEWERQRVYIPGEEVTGIGIPKGKVPGGKGAVLYEIHPAPRPNP